MFEDVIPNSEKWLSLNDLLNEEWKNIKGYENLYQVSNYGRIKSLKKHSIFNNRTYPTKILKCHINTKKYLDIELCRCNKSHRYRIHRLVAEHFIPNPENKPQVNHIDCDKSNNKTNNLEWCNNSENQQHAFKNGLNTRKKYGDSPRAKKVNQYNLNGDFIKTWDSIIRIKDECGYCDGFISQCCKGKYKQAYGYLWKYEKEM